jgi:hypothetical protein
LELHFDSSNIRSGPPTNATRIWVWFHSQVCTVDCTRLPANAEALRTVQRLVPSCPPPPDDCTYMSSAIGKQTT